MKLEFKSEHLFVKLSKTSFPVVMWQKIHLQQYRIRLGQYTRCTYEYLAFSTLYVNLQQRQMSVNYVVERHRGNSDRVENVSTPRVIVRYLLKRGPE